MTHRMTPTLSCWSFGFSWRYFFKMSIQFL